MIEGDLVDHDGIRYGPGDFVWLRAVTAHILINRSRLPDRCVCHRIRPTRHRLAARQQI